MRKAINIVEDFKEPKKTKDIEFIRFLNPARGLEKAIREPKSFNRIVCVGKTNSVTNSDLDLFCAYDDEGIVSVFEGRLNDGTY